MVRILTLVLAGLIFFGALTWLALALVLIVMFAWLITESEQEP